jgi:P2 family phage contractile tail tube protein
MGLPRKLKDLMLFNAGEAYVGQVGSFTLPKLTRKMEEWRGGGMDTPFEIDMGGEKLEAEWTCGGPIVEVLRQSGRSRPAPSHSASSACSRMTIPAK